MIESQYIQQIRQLISGFNAADYDRQEAETQAQQAYKHECQNTNATFRGQQHTCQSAKSTAKARYDSACKSAKEICQNAQSNAAAQINLAREARDKSIQAAMRVAIQLEDAKTLNKNVLSVSHKNPIEGLSNVTKIATDSAQAIQDTIDRLQCLREEKKRRRQRMQQLLKVLFVVTIIVLVIAGVIIKRICWKAKNAEKHYNKTVNAVQMKDWRSARNELDQLLAINQNYKDAQILRQQIDALKVLEVLETIEFVQLSGGCFQMGHSKAEKGRDSDESSEHKVCVDGFEIGKYEVTQAQWEKIMEENPSHFTSKTRGGNSANYPVENVSWNDIQKFINKLNQSVGRNVYRLPTEGEWEYAARAGTQTVYSFGNDADELRGYAWYGENSGKQTHPVGQLKPNAWGLYDMHGNVWEWCQDVYNYRGSKRVKRGGSWFDIPIYVQSATRYGYLPSFRDNELGFRLVRNHSDN